MSDSDVMRLTLIEVSEERDRQDLKWGGPEHDDKHTMAEWVKLIKAYADWAEVMHGMNSLDKARNRLIQVAAMSVAAVESLDRKCSKDLGQHLIPLPPVSPERADVEALTALLGHAVGLGAFLEPGWDPLTRTADMVWLCSEFGLLLDYTRRAVVCPKHEANLLTVSWGPDYSLERAVVMASIYMAQRRLDERRTKV